MDNRKQRGIYTGKKRRKKSTLLITLIIMIIVVVTCITSAAIFINSQINKLNYENTNMQKNSVNKINYSELGIDKNVEENLKKYTNIALLGIDARKGEKAENCRSDAIIIVSIHNETGEIILTSVARDTYLLMNSLDGEEMLDKATHAHAFGGPINTVKMLNQSLDLNIKHYVVLNWNSVVDLVDAVGGITINIEDNEIYDLNTYGPGTAMNTDKQWTDITSSGTQKIDGVQAATYCRIRKNSGGDQGRTERMKKVVKAVFNEVKSNPTLVTKITNDVFPQITTNMTSKEIVSLAKNLLNFNITNSIAYPYSYWGGLVNDSWLAVPTTLEENNAQLHSEVFGNIAYNGSNKVKEISEQIIFNTGISEGRN